MKYFKTDNDRLDFAIGVEMSVDGLYALHPKYGTKTEREIRLPEKDENGDRIRETRTIPKEELSKMKLQKEKSSVFIRERLLEIGFRKPFLDTMDNDSLYYFVCGLTA